MAWRVACRCEVEVALGVRSKGRGLDRSLLGWNLTLSVVFTALARFNSSDRYFAVYLEKNDTPKYADATERSDFALRRAVDRRVAG